MNSTQTTENAPSTITFEADKATNNEIYVKLGSLKDNQIGKDYYLLLADGDAIEGILEGTRLSTGKYPGRNEFLIRPFTGDKLMVLAQAGNLGARMTAKGIGNGDAVRIVYNGKNVAAKGKFAGTAMHNFTVLGEA